jgi:hypothetical protein
MSPEKPHTLMSTVEKNIHMQRMLEDILADRRMLQSTRGKHASPALSLEVPAVISKKTRVALNLLHVMNGQRGQTLRFVATRKKGVIAQYLQDLYQWSVTAAEGNATIQDLESMNVPSIVDTLFHEEGITEAVVLNHLMTEGCTETPPSSDDVLSAHNLTTLLEQRGVLPMSLVTLKNFRQITNNLREIEMQSQVPELQALAKHERAALLNHLFESGIAEQIRSPKQKNVTLDSRGLFITFQNFQSHIPLALVSDACLAVLKQASWISEAALAEVSVRQAAENNLRHEYDVRAEEQVTQFTQRFLEKTGRRFDDVYIQTEVFNDPEAFAKQLHTHELVLPDQAIAMMLRSNQHTGYVALLSIAQTISGLVAEKTFRDEYQTLQPLQRGVLKKEYDAHEKALLQPAYYTASKITRALLAEQVTSDPQQKFLVFQGQFGKTEHRFLEAIDGTRLARILFEDSKSTPAADLPVVEQAVYERLEAKLRALQAVRATLGRITTLINQGAMQAVAQSDIEAVRHFLLTNTTAFEQAEALYRSIETDPTNRTLWTQFALLCRDAVDRYESTVYQQLHENPGNEEEYVETRTVRFDHTYLEGIRTVATPSHFNEALCASGVETRLALIESGTTSETVPFALEEAALDAIRINRNKPLINVIGGCKHLEGEVFGSLQKIAQAVLMVAHEFKANVSVPGSQSGIGTVFGEAYLQYMQQFGALPLKDQARMFSIISGGDVYFPENPYLAPDRNPYGLVPIPMVATKHRAGWELRGNAKRTSAYLLRQIKHMESFYKRMCAGKQVDAKQPRISLVGNGGLYSLWELDEIIDDDFDIMLIRGSGRFADIAAYMLEQAPSDFNWEGDIEASSALILELLAGATGNPYLDDATVNEFKKKDFGFDAVLNLDPLATETTDEAELQKQDYQIYREAFCRFMQRANQNRNRIHFTTVETVETDLRTLL